MRCWSEIRIRILAQRRRGAKKYAKIRALLWALRAGRVKAEK